jgi:FimV-like protein
LFYLRVDRPDAKAPVQDMSRAVALGAACCALAAAAGVYLGDALGLLVPVAAAIAGGAMLALLGSKQALGPASGPATADAAEPASMAEQSPVGAGEAANRSAAERTEPAPGIPQGPAETHEVQLKLDLARSYLEMDEAGLAIPLLQEILETELAVAARLGSDAVRETR